MSFLRNKNQKWLLMSAAALLIVLVPAMSAAKNPKIAVTVGQSVTYKLAQPVKTVSIANSDVADVVVAGPREVLINGKDIGLTTLVIWDQDNKSNIFDVVVRGPFADQKIELQVKVAEVNRTKATQLGFDFLWGGAHKNTDYLGGTYGGGISTPSIPLSIFGGQPTQDLTAVLGVSGTAQFQAMIKAAISNGVISILAEPTVVAASGKPASFISGGEIPVPIASAGAQGGSTVTIEWKEFGVKVDFLPTIVDSNVINLHVAPEVSNLDYTNGVQISGFTIPSIRTRRAETTVELRDQETLVIGGLIMEDESDIRTRIPLLGHIPILGYLFSDWEKITTTYELVIVVTPHIVRALPPGTEVSLPGQNEEVEE
jgi:Flp pilus assembly secretin CpaC